jgi:hypothetical protein
MHGIDIFAVEAAILLGFAAVLTLVLAKLGYLVTLWNSHSVIWLRQRLSLAGAKPLDTGDGGDG